MLSCAQGEHEISGEHEIAVLIVKYLAALMDHLAHTLDCRPDRLTVGRPNAVIECLHDRSPQRACLAQAQLMRIRHGRSLQEKLPALAQRDPLQPTVERNQRRLTSVK